MRTARILVVDDEPLACQMFTDVLESRGFQVMTAARGEEAFPRLPDADLVLLDAMLPGRDGWSICEEIKQKHDPLLPVIMVTARTAPEDVVRTFKAGADDYVAKPFHVAELIARIESRLRVHRAERALQEANRRLAEMAHQNYELYEQARRDAEERTHLLRELDHRVRNNLSVIMGLVSMERNRVPPRPPQEALASLESRLRSFLLVHEALRQQGYQGVPVREVVERIAQRLRNARPEGGHIHLEVLGDAGLLDERQGFAIALVLNELITNALRHGFPEGRAGTLTLRLGRTAGEVLLAVADDGVGVPRDGDDRVLGSGRSIVEALVRRELSGRVEYPVQEQGTEVVVYFPA
jgi:two-component sensor histidine kinase